MMIRQEPSSPQTTLTKCSAGSKRTLRTWSARSDDLPSLQNCGPALSHLMKRVDNGALAARHCCKSRRRSIEA
jgi:hypothetical protein